MIVSANEGWTALFGYGEKNQLVVIARQVALWHHREEGDRSGGRAIVGLVVDDFGSLEPANHLERFICYCAPDDDPKEIIRRRAARDGSSGSL